MANIAAEGFHLGAVSGGSAKKCCFYAFMFVVYLSRTQTVFILQTINRIPEINSEFEEKMV